MDAILLRARRYSHVPSAHFGALYCSIEALLVSVFAIITAGLLWLGAWLLTHAIDESPLHFVLPSDLGLLFLLLAVFIWIAALPGIAAWVRHEWRLIYSLVKAVSIKAQGE